MNLNMLRRCVCFDHLAMEVNERGRIAKSISLHDHNLNFHCSFFSLPVSHLSLFLFSAYPISPSLMTLLLRLFCMSLKVPFFFFFSNHLSYVFVTLYECFIIRGRFRPAIHYGRKCKAAAYRWLPDHLQEIMDKVISFPKHLLLYRMKGHLTWI